MTKVPTEDELKKKLTPEQYRILRQKGTEAPFTGQYLNHKANGMYCCAACGAELFTSNNKYDSSTPGLAGWPSFADVVKSNAVKLAGDNSLGMKRIEVICQACGSHLGHVFDDKDSPSGRHYCINSACLAFESTDKHKK